MKAIIDADLLIYRVGFGAEDKSEGIACARMDESIRLILLATNATERQLYLTSDDKSNFRHTIFPDYKANRKAPKPKHYHLLRDYLVNNHAAELCYDQEADDAIGIEATRITETEGLAKCIICSIDKDLDQIPGMHYNFVKGIIYNINPYEGRLKFYTQILMGDATDNIQGIPRIGRAKAAKALLGCTSEEEMYNASLKAYRTVFGVEAMDKMLLNGQLVKIRTKEGELWQHPVVERSLTSEPQP